MDLEKSSHFGFFRLARCSLPHQMYRKVFGIDFDEVGFFYPFIGEIGECAISVSLLPSDISSSKISFEVLDRRLQEFSEDREVTFLQISKLKPLDTHRRSVPHEIDVAESSKLERRFRDLILRRFSVGFSGSLDLFPPDHHPVLLVFDQIVDELGRDNFYPEETLFDLRMSEMTISSSLSVGRSDVSSSSADLNLRNFLVDLRAEAERGSVVLKINDLLSKFNAVHPSKPIEYLHGSYDREGLIVVSPPREEKMIKIRLRNGRRLVSGLSDLSIYSPDEIQEAVKLLDSRCSSNPALQSFRKDLMDLLAGLKYDS